MAYKMDHTPKSHWALHLFSEMREILAPREFSTIRFEASYSVVKQNTYFNFLNLPLTVANFHAFRAHLQGHILRKRIAI